MESGRDLARVGVKSCELEELEVSYQFYLLTPDY